MLPIRKGRFVVREADSSDDLLAAQRLRARCFVSYPQEGARAGAAVMVDTDHHDALCTHFLVEEIATGTLVGCFRMLVLGSGAEIDESYSAQYYDLGRLHAFQGCMAEIGRFCIHPQWHDSNIVRLAWAAIVEQIDTEGIEMLFGCSSFTGTDPAPYIGAFAALKAYHLAPPQWLPSVRAPEVFRFAEILGDSAPDPRRVSAEMPPLLRSYLGMGGWVSDHAVIDRQLDTLHVFTGLRVASVSQARVRLLRETVRRGREVGAVRS